MYKKIISIDFGVKILGFCIFNYNILNNFNIFYLKNQKYKKNFFKKIFFFFNPDLIIIGFPKFYKSNLKTYINIIFLIKNFIIKIINKYNIKIKIINEEFSSKLIFIKKKKIDPFSSLYILKYYLKLSN